MGDVMECQYRRCPGEVPVQAEGLDGEGRPQRLGTCTRCGRVTTEVPPVEQDALPGLDGGGAA